MESKQSQVTNNVCSGQVLEACKVNRCTYAGARSPTVSRLVFKSTFSAYKLLSHTRTHARMHAHTHAHTYAHTHFAPLLRTFPQHNIPTCPDVGNNQAFKLTQWAYMHHSHSPIHACLQLGTHQMWAALPPIRMLKQYMLQRPWVVTHAHMPICQVIGVPRCTHS